MKVRKRKRTKTRKRKMEKKKDASRRKKKMPQRSVLTQDGSKNDLCDRIVTRNRDAIAGKKKQILSN